MRIKTVGSVVVLAFALMSTAAWACPGQGAKRGATTVADKSVKTDDGAKKGGCGHHKAAQTASEGKGGCQKKCQHGAKTVADKDAKGGCNKKCHKNCQHGATTVADKGDCPIGKKVDAILASLPSMKYRVGDEVTCCSKSATAMSEKAGKPVRFVVGETTYGDQGEAAIALASMLEKELESMEQIQYAVAGETMQCPKSAKLAADKAHSKVAYRVAGFDFADQAKAEQVAKLVADAAGKAQIAYKVDGKVYHCDKMAGSKCKATGKKMTYVVGESETCCDKEAKVLLVEAKIRNAVEAAAGAFAS